MILENASHLLLHGLLFLFLTQVKAFLASFGLNGTKPKTQHEIAEMMGISRSYVSRIETKAIGKLAKEFKD